MANGLSDAEWPGDFLSGWTGKLVDLEPDIGINYPTRVHE
jgi:hypothetical protein